MSSLSMLHTYRRFLRLSSKLGDYNTMSYARRTIQSRFRTDVGTTVETIKMEEERLKRCVTINNAYIHSAKKSVMDNISIM